MAERNPKAEGMQWFNSFLVVNDVKAALEFYEKSFGFETRLTMPDKSGENYIHAEMVYHDCPIMFGPANPEQKLKSPSDLSGSPVSFYLYVDNVDEFCDKAGRTGAKLVEELKDQFWGDRTCAFECPEGYRWMFAQNVADFDPSQAPGQ